MENVWYETDRKDNAVATASHAAEPNVKHVITGIYAAYSAAKTGTLIIKEGTSSKITLDVQNSLSVNNVEIEFTSGAAISAVLSASGTAGTNGSVLLTGYT